MCNSIILSIAYCSLFTFSDLLTDQSQISTSKEVATENASTYSDFASNCDTLAQMMDLFFHGTICTTERPTARECDRNAPCHSDRPRPKSAAERPAANSAEIQPQETLQTDDLMVGSHWYHWWMKVGLQVPYWLRYSGSHTPLHTCRRKNMEKRENILPMMRWSEGIGKRPAPWRTLKCRYSNHFACRNHMSQFAKPDPNTWPSEPSGVSPCLTFTWPRSQAMCRGLRPSPWLSFRSALASSNSRATSRCPCSAAICKGLFPTDP